MESMKAETKELVGRPERGEDLISCHVKPRRVWMKIVFEQELADIGSASVEWSFYSTLLGIVAGGLIASVAVITTVEMKSAAIRAGWIAGSIVCFLARVCFAGLSFISWRRLRQRIKLIGEESAPVELGNR